MVQIFACAAFILILCNLIGQLWVNRWEKYQDSLWMATIMGMITLFAVFQVAAVPAIYLKWKLHVLVIYMAVVMLALCAASVFQLYKSRGAYYTHQLQKIRTAVKNKRNIWLLVAAVLILYQTYYAAFYEAGNGDDVRYIGAVVDAVDTDEMLMYHPATGEYLGEIASEFWKDAAAPILMFWAMWCRLLHINASTFTHIVIALFMVPLAYGAAYLMGYKLCREDNRRTGMFLCVYCLYHFVNHVLPIESIGKTIYYMRWGKSVLYCFLIPLTIFFLMEMLDTKKGVSQYIRLGTVLLGGCLSSTMACVMLPALTGVWAVCDGIYNRSVRRFLVPLLLCVPPVCYALYYVHFAS